MEKKVWKIRRGLRILLPLVLLWGCASGDRPLQLLQGAGPIYPEKAKAQQLEGTVTVRYDVTAAGRVVNAQVVAANPAGVFEEAALQAVRSWRFNAPKRGGVSTQALGIESTVTFRLAGADKYDGY